MIFMNSLSRFYDWINFGYYKQYINLFSRKPQTTFFDVAYNNVDQTKNMWWLDGKLSLVRPGSVLRHAKNWGSLDYQ